MHLKNFSPEPPCSVSPPLRDFKWCVFCFDDIECIDGVFIEHPLVPSTRRGQIDLCLGSGVHFKFND